MSGADAICGRVGQSDAVFFLPDYVTDNTATVCLDIPDFNIGLWRRLIHRRDKWLSPTVRAVIERLKQHGILRVKRRISS